MSEYLPIYIDSELSLTELARDVGRVTGMPMVWLSRSAEPAYVGLDSLRWIRLQVNDTESHFGGNFDDYHYKIEAAPPPGPEAVELDEWMDRFGPELFDQLRALEQPILMWDDVRGRIAEYVPPRLEGVKPPFEGPPSAERHAYIYVGPGPSLPELAGRVGDVLNAQLRHEHDEFELEGCPVRFDWYVGRYETADMRLDELKLDPEDYAINPVGYRFSLSLKPPRLRNRADWEHWFEDVARPAYESLKALDLPLMLASGNATRVEEYTPEGPTRE